MLHQDAIIDAVGMSGVCSVRDGHANLPALAARRDGGAPAVLDLIDDSPVLVAVGRSNVEPWRASNGLCHVREHLHSGGPGGCSLVVDVPPASIPDVVQLQSRC